MINRPLIEEVQARWKTIALVTAVILVGIKAVKEGRWHVLPKRLVQVEEGLYRSGQLEAYPYDRLVRTEGIKTVLRLNPIRAEDPRSVVEAEVVEQHGLSFVEIPMENGSGLVPYEDLERAAEVLAEAERPILFHCSAGSRRSSAVQVVYRLEHCGWTWDQVREELEEQGLIPLRKGARLLTHLENYRDWRQEREGTLPLAASAALPRPSSASR